MKRKLFNIIAAFTACLFLFSGCGGQGDNNGPKTSPEINITDSSLTMDYFDNYTFTAELKNTTGITWKSSDSSILSVNQDGTAVTNYKEGKVTVTATSGEVSDTCEVTVIMKSDIPVFSVKKELNVAVGGSYVLTPALYYKGLDITEYTEIKFNAVDDNSFVSAEKIGNEIKFTGENEGDSEYTVYTTMFGTLYAETVKVGVKNVDFVYIVDGAVGEYLYITRDKDVYTSNVKIYYQDQAVNDSVLTWNVNNDNIVSISDNGKLVANKEGETFISTEYMGYAVSVYVKVVKERVNAEFVQEKSLPLNLDVQITANLITYPTTGERYYEVNPSHTETFRLADSSIQGEIIKAVVDGETLDKDFFSFADGQVSVLTKVFGTERYGEYSLYLELETEDIIYVYTVDLLLITKNITNLNDFKSAIVIQWVGDTIFGYFTLGTDMNFNNYVISSYATDWNWLHGFRGTLDGCGHKILGYKGSTYGMTAQIGEDAVIKNIEFSEIRYDGYNGQANSCIFARGAKGATFENISITFNSESAFIPSDSNLLQSGMLIGHDMHNCRFKDISIYAYGKTITNVFGGKGNGIGTSVYENVKVYAAGVSYYEYDVTNIPSGVELIVG